MWTPDDFEIRIKRVHHQWLGDAGRERLRSGVVQDGSRYRARRDSGDDEAGDHRGRRRYHLTRYAIRGAWLASCGEPVRHDRNNLRERSARDDCGTWQPMGSGMH
jgi:hypothetical protein